MCPSSSTFIPVVGGDLTKWSFLPPQDVGAADGAEGPVEDRGSKSNKELKNSTNIRIIGLYLILFVFFIKTTLCDLHLNLE